ncbi:HupE/UreJ family protein [Alteraurantiacibacter aquimixticola]|nr:HupE/UreJ family protein [Alteraurantiacibacter aquimixticola]
MKLSVLPVPSLQRRLLGILAMLAVLILLTFPANAHPAPFSYLDLQLEEEGIEGTVTVHVIDLAHELQLDEPAILLDEGVLEAQHSKISQLLQQRFRIGEAGELPDPVWRDITVVPDDDAVRLNFTIPSAPPSALEVEAQLFTYDPIHQTFVNVWEGGEIRQQWILGVGAGPRTHFAGTTAGVFAVLGTFIPSGIHHIAIGPDHILFIIGLILLGGSWQRLAIIVTSFTIGHSVTLSLAALDIVMVPAHVIEPLIALSIVVVGADNLMRGEGKDFRAVIAFVFGLIHGFGFAYVLKEFGLPDAQLAWSLFAFNFGVEIGQLLIVLVVTFALHLVRQRSEKLARRIATIGSLAVIAAGAYWFIDRVFLSGAG